MVKYLKPKLCPAFTEDKLRELFEAEQEGKALRLEFIQEVNRI